MACFNDCDKHGMYTATRGDAPCPKCEAAARRKAAQTLTVAEPQAKHDHTDAFQRIQPLQAGYYWRALADCQDAKKGDIPSGTVLLLKSLRTVDDEIHTVILHPHPGSNRQGEHYFLVADFLDAFEPEPDGKAIREEEMRAIQQEINDLQQEMAQGQNDPVALLELAREEGYRDTTTSSAPVHPDTPVTALINPNSAEEQLAAVQIQMENQVALATARSKYLTTMTDRLSRTIAKLSPFYSEMGVVAMAQCEDVLAKANTILKGVATLGLYTGKDVEVHQLCDGEGAPAGALLYLFQRKLYMDEESLINLADGGADYSNLEDFARELATNPALLNRLIPASRGVVAMAYRRRDKRYSDDPWENAHKNAANRASFLLVRNGHKVYQVYSELGTHGATRLFPTTNQMEQPFRGVRGEDITIQDVRFADARDRHDDIALHYRRLLVLICGLHDRLALFGELPVPGAGPLELFALEAQERAFRLVYDDEGAFLGQGMPKYRDWMREKNTLLRSGSRVACVWRQVMTPENCPSVVKDNSRSCNYTFTYSPMKDEEIVIAYQDKDDICVKAQVSGYSWSSGKDREFMARVALNKAGSCDYLVLDAVTSKELDYYIHSRHDRVNYLDYIPTMAAARDFLRKEEAAEAPARERLHAALVEGKIVAPEADVTSEISDVVRKWRAANRGRELPTPEDADFWPVQKKLLDQLYVILGHSRDLAAAVEELAHAEGRHPLRLVVTGNKKLALYATPREDEREDRLGGHVWVQRLTLEQKKTKVSVVTRQWQVLPKIQADETVLQEWPGAEEWSGRVAIQGLSYEAARAVFSSIGDVVGSLKSWLAGEEFDDHLLTAQIAQERLSSSYVSHGAVLFPLALFEKKGTPARQDPFGGTYPATSPKYQMLVMAVDAPDLLYLAGNEDQRSQIKRWFRTIYRNPSHALDGLGSGAFSLSRLEKIAGAEQFGSIGPRPWTARATIKLDDLLTPGAALAPEGWDVVAVADLAAVVGAIKELEVAA